jgi:hypothetical protein
MAEARGDEYVGFASLEAARSHSDATAILEGDDGGTIYLTVPVRHVRCDEQRLHQLLLDIDARYWRDATMAHLAYETRRVGDTVAGGMGGGHVADGVWLHPKIEELDIRAAVEAILRGERARLTPVK